MHESDRLFIDFFNTAIRIFIKIALIVPLIARHLCISDNEDARIYEFLIMSSERKSECLLDVYCENDGLLKNC